MNGEMNGKMNGEEICINRGWWLFHLSPDCDNSITMGRRVNQSISHSGDYWVAHTHTLYSGRRKTELLTDKGGGEHKSQIECPGGGEGGGQGEALPFISHQ